MPASAAGPLPVVPRRPGHRLQTGDFPQYPGDQRPGYLGTVVVTCDMMRLYSGAGLCLHLPEQPAGGGSHAPGRCHIPGIILSLCHYNYTIEDAQVRDLFCNFAILQILSLNTLLSTFVFDSLLILSFTILLFY